MKKSVLPSSNNQTTPIMVDWLVYYSTGVGGVVALDAANGEVAWHVDAPAASGAAPGSSLNGDADVPIGGATRSLTYWTDGKDSRIIALIGNKYLTALNAKTGERYAEFGKHGEVDLSAKENGGDGAFFWSTGPTAIVRDVVIVGSVILDINNSQVVSKFTMPQGDVRGIDVRTGKYLWTWQAIPQQGQEGGDLAQRVLEIHRQYQCLGGYQWR